MNQEIRFPYSANDMIIISDMGIEFGEEMQGLKRNGLQPERKERITDLLSRMKPYKSILKIVISKYLADNPDVAEYKESMGWFVIPDD